MLISDRIKIVVALLLVIAGVSAYYYLDGMSELLRVLAVIAGVAAALAVTGSSDLGRQAMTFTAEARQEVRKVIWPTGRETMQATLMVIGMVILVGLYIWIVDGIVYWIVYDTILSP